MFESAINPGRRVHGASFLTTAIAAALHAIALGAVAVTALAATDLVSAPRAIEAFVAAAAPPPPPPPPAVVEAPRKAKPPKATRPNVRRRLPPNPKPLAASVMPAPAEAPTEISEEVEASTDDVADAEFKGVGVEGGVPGGVEGGIVGTALPSLPPPRVPAPPKPVRVGGHIVAPRLLHRVSPAYPRVALDARVQGVVVLEATVGAKGDVRSVRVLRAHSLLQEAALHAVKQWRYEPLRLNGTPTPFVLTVTVAFNLK